MMTFDKSKDVPLAGGPTHGGLTAAEAAQRLQEDGLNVLPADQPRGWLAIVRETLSDPMFALLLGAGVLYLVLGDLQEGLILFGLVLVMVCRGALPAGKWCAATC
jgi:Ca2+-transporting ATPase